MGIFRCLYVQTAIPLLLLTQTSSTETSAHANSTGGCIANERSTLAHFKAGLSDPVNCLSSWLGDDCCRWKGVHCSKKTGHVIKLDLQGPDCYLPMRSTQMLGGNISSSLLGLKHLWYLDLSCNWFSGLQIPEFLPSLHGLRYLSLSNSYFAGKIPPQLGNLSNLNSLALGSLLDANDIYSMDITWLSRLSSLEHPDMSFVNLSSIPNWLAVMNMLPSLKVLLLVRCELNNSPDSLVHSNLTSLETLDISFNYLSKRIAPNWFWDLIGLKRLDISLNKLA